METKKDLYKKAIEEINNAPKSHYELCKIAKERLKKLPKAKFKMKVFLQSNNKEFCTLEASTKEKLIKSQSTFSNSQNGRLLYYGEIKPIKN